MFAFRVTLPHLRVVLLRPHLLASNLLHLQMAAPLQLPVLPGQRLQPLVKLELHLLQVTGRHMSPTGEYLYQFGMNEFC